ncbi:MAG: DUF4328 domain-containing protein [Flavobacteriaceae bacterium]|nr:DUF4328 domain-containing protein [Flavobacteriaceae bacterium]
MSAIRPNQQRADLAVKFVIIVMIMDIVSVGISWRQLDIINLIDRGGDYTDEMITTNDWIVSISGLVYLVIYIVAAVFFIQWFRRGYYNLSQRVQCEHSDGWAAGSWFVPIISLFRPYRIMKEMWYKTARIIGQRLNVLERPSEAVIGWWWAFWIIATIIGNSSLGTIFGDETLESLRKTTITDIIVYLLNIPTGLLAIRMIKDYARMEEKLKELEDIEGLGIETPA